MRLGAVVAGPALSAAAFERPPTDARRSSVVAAPLRSRVVRAEDGR
jgi:hypothetical protein